MRRAVIVIGLAALGGCAIGPRYTTPTVAPATHAVGTAPVPEQTLFDSLARASALPPATQASATASAGGDAFAWLDVLKDPALVSLVRAALRDNRNLKTVIARIDEYEGDRDNARSALFPEAGLNGTGSTNRVVFGSSAPINYRALTAVAEAQWEVDFFGRLRRGLSAAEADIDAVRADERAGVLMLVADVSDGYLALLEAREDLDVSRRTLASRQSTLGLARQRYAQGLISELDVRQFEADVAAASVSVAQYTRETAQDEHSLSLLVGQAPGPLVTGASLDSSVAAVSVPDSIPSSVLLRRPDVMSEERMLAAATDRIGVAEGELVPRVTISGQYGYQSPALSTLFGSNTDIYTLQGGILIPLSLFGGGGHADVKIARARTEQARAQYEQTVLTAMSEAADALVGVRTNREQLAAQTAEAAALRDAYALAERRYEGGIASYLEVLDAQRSLFAAELALNGTRRQYLEATVQLYKALGGRWNDSP
ncbi:MAG TPA: efflux transporter outer membrane subunit [Gemmatimonadales bacterium]|jgi:multidrug efflux system outer membrane protein|nr:efflux transporter outer membrane subunit [Gemmatimonadales bacterium]